MATVIIGSHKYNKKEPTLETIEDAIRIASITRSEDLRKIDLAWALSLILTGNVMYQKQLLEESEETLLSAFSRELLGQINKLSVSVSYIKAINSLAAREE